MPPAIRAALAGSDDQALLARIAERDLAAFDTFYRRHYARLFRFTARVTRRPELVEEVVSATMHIVWDKAASFRAEARPTSWLMGIAYRQANQRLRGLDRAPKVALDDLAEELVDPVSLEALAERRAIGRLVRQALGDLTPAHRAVVELTYFQGYSCAEVALMLSCPVGTVKTRMLHARARLKALLQRQAALTPEDLA